MRARLLDNLRRDVLLAFRALRAAPILSAVAITSLALGIGANTAIFSIVNGLLLRTLPVTEPARLVLLTDTTEGHVRVWSYPVWTEIQRRPELFERSGAWSMTEFNLASGGEAQLIEGMWASGSFFETLAVPALLGRTFSGVDDRPGGGSEGPVAVISYGFWQRRFGAVPDVVGRSLSLDNVPFTIIGVTPASFTGPEIGRAFDVIVPVASEPLVRGHDSFLDDSGVQFLTIIARLRPNQSVDAATAGLRQVQTRIRDATLGEIGRFGSRSAIDRYLSAPFVLAPGATGYSGARDLRGEYERPLGTIMAVAILLLLIACVNIANLLVARAIAIRHEISLRYALGASRGRLVQQVVTESAVLYGIGAASGLILAVWGGHLLVRQLSTPGNTVFLNLSLDRHVLGFTILLTMVVTLLFGVAPVLRASRAAPMDALKQQTRATTARGRQTLTSWLVIVQVSLSLVLAVAAGLFIRTFSSLTTRPLGFDPAPVLLAKVDAHHTTDDAVQRIALYDSARDAVRRVPDVAEAALSLTTPVGPGQFTPLVEIDRISDTHGPVWANLISPGWFSTFQIPILAGRDLTDRDRAGAPRVAVVNEAFARKFVAGNPIGHTITLYPHTPRAMGPIEIVGVVGDAVYASLRSPAPPTYYIPLAQFDYLPELGIRSIDISIRSKGAAPMSLARSVGPALTAVNPRLTVTFRPLVSQLDAALVRERLIAVLAGFFGMLAVLLAGLGLYGLTAYAVTSRRTEIGIRMALGAPAARVIRLIVARTSLMVGTGMILGVCASLWTSRFVRSLLYGVEPNDPVTLISALTLLAVVAGFSALLPARRAVRIDPAVVLRDS